MSETSPTTSRGRPSLPAPDPARTRRDRVRHPPRTRAGRHPCRVGAERCFGVRDDDQIVGELREGRQQEARDGVLTPGSGSFTERLYHPVSVDGPIFEYNAELHLGKEFRQEPNQVYWLKIVALVDQNPNLPIDLQTR